MKEFNGNYRGTVVNNNDPLKAGRIRVRMHGVYDNVSDEALPWAIYADPLMGGVANVGGFFIPDEGGEVWCFFENGDFMKPVFFAGAVGGKGRQEEKGSELGTYPKNRSFKTHQGHVVEFDDTPDQTRIRIHHKSGTEITMLDNGDVEETVIGNVIRNVEGNVTETIKGDHTVNVEGSQTWNITGDQGWTINGSLSFSIDGSADIIAQGVFTIDGQTIHIG